MRTAASTAFSTYTHEQSAIPARTRSSDMVPTADPLHMTPIPAVIAPPTPPIGCIPMSRLDTTSADATTIRTPGERLSSFGGCNYLGLSHHPRVVAALTDGAARFGVSAGASRETTGNTRAHDELETLIADRLGLEAAIVLPEGFTANLALMQALTHEHAVCAIDEKSHVSLHHSAAMCDIVAHAYPHQDAPAAGRTLREVGARLVLTDGVFTAEGAVAPVRDLLGTLPPDGLLVVDDCHGFGVLGPRGTGTCAYVGLRDPRIIVTSTLAKAIGAYGGFIAGPARIVDAVRHTASVYRCTTGLPPGLAMAASEALRVIDDEPERLERLHANVLHTRHGLRAHGVHVIDTPAPIFAFTLAPESRMRRVHEALRNAGVLAPLIEYPGGPARIFFRLIVTSQHALPQIDAMLDILGESLRDSKT